MSTSVYLTVTDLTFPDKLEDKYCKFRPVISLRYHDANGKIAYARAAMPGLGPRDYWECEKGNEHNKNAIWVRSKTAPKVDMDALDVMRREATLDDLDVKSFDRIEVEVFDIDIKVGWEILLDKAIDGLGPEAIAFLNPALPPTLMAIKAAVEKATGKKTTDIESGLLAKLTGRVDGAARSIFAKSTPLTNPPQSEVTLSGPGIEGTYSITVSIEVS